MDHGTQFHSAAEDWECIRAQSWQARKGSAGFSCCCCTIIASSLFLSWTWKWRILRYIDIGFVWRRFGCLGSASCLLVHSCSPCEFSSECLLLAKMTELGMQCFFFLIPCQSAVPSDSRVGGPSSSHFQKLLLKIAWRWRWRLFFLTQMMGFDKNISLWWVHAKGEMLALTNCAYFSFCEDGVDIKSPMQPGKITPDWGRTGVMVHSSLLKTS